MAEIKIAVMVSNLRLSLDEALRATADMGATGVHLSASWTGCTPDDLKARARRDLVAKVRGLGLEFSAISAWGGQVDLGEEDGWDEHIEHGKRLLELSVDLECAIWQGHCGIMPHQTDDPKWARFVRAFGEICRHGERVGACLAIETGPEPPAILKRMMEDVGSSALTINYDPANLILWPARYMELAGEPYDREKAFAEYQPTEGVTVLGDAITHTHAKDAHVTAEGKREEVPLGDGWVDWPRYVALLRAHGYDGYYAIEREVGADPVGDVRGAVDFLKSIPVT